MKWIHLKWVVIRFASNIFTWAAILTITIGIFISDLFPKYKAEIVSKEVSKNVAKAVFYDDLNHDGNSEEIVVTDNKPFGSISVLQNDNVICYLKIKQNALGDFLGIQCLDFNNDGRNEIFYFTQSFDSVFVNTIFFDENFNFQDQQKLVSTIDKNNKDGFDFQLSIIREPADLNNDGKLEIYFIIKSGFSYQPRKLYCYDAQNDTIYKSPDCGAYISEASILYNPSTQKNVVFTNVLSLGNYSEKFVHIPYPDTLAWLILFDKQLKFLFPPIENKGYSNFIHTNPIQRNDSLYIICCTSSYMQKDNVIVSFYNLNGEFISKLEIDDLFYKNTVFSYGNDGNLQYPTPFADNNGNLYNLSQDLKTFTKKNFLKSSFDKCQALLFYDLDNDGNCEKILNYSTGIAIVRNDLSDVCYLEINNPDFNYFSAVLKIGELPCFSLFANNTCFVICYQKNKFYYWQYALYVSIFLVILVLLYVFQKLRTYQLEQENLKLNQIIKERTSEIRSQKEEIQAQAENLVQLGTFKEKMISMIVHDLKNPLSMILHGSEKASVINAAQEMNILVENMLDINKFEQAKLKLHIENQLLNNLIYEAYKKVEYLFDIKNLEFKNQVGDTIFVRCDAMIVERIFINLLNNAAKYTPNNGTVSVYTEIWGNSKMIITVADNGRGIEKDFLNRIFGQYESQQGISSNIIHSTGLGLTFCKLAVEAHNGKIGVESEINKGTKISFSLDFENITETLQSIKTNEIKIRLTPEERNYLSQYHNVLKNIELYEISELRRIIKQIETDENVNEDWKRNLQHAVISFNSEFYKYLIDMINPLF